MSESTQQHRDQAAGRSANCSVLTVSDTRTKETDKGGRIIIEALEAAGHTIAGYEIVKDEPDQIETQLTAWRTAAPESPGPRPEAQGPPPPDAIITTGGTGIARRDTTVEVVRRIISKANGKELEGFGELFRMLSWAEVGPAAMLSRAVAGLAGETLIFALPGSSNAVNLAMAKLIVPELPHLVWERAR